MILVTPIILNGNIRDLIKDGMCRLMAELYHAAAAPPIGEMSLTFAVNTVYITSLVRAGDHFHFIFYLFRIDYSINLFLVCMKNVDVVS